MESLDADFSTETTSQGVTNSNMMESCRVCMGRDRKMKQIFIKATIIDRLVDRLQFCTGIQVNPNDGLPTQICEFCVQNLNIAHKFKTMCLLSQEAFQKLLLEANVKSEVDTLSDYEAESFDENKQSFDEEFKLDIKKEVLDILVEKSVTVPKVVGKKGQKKSKSSVTKIKVEKPAVKKRRKYKKRDPAVAQIKQIKTPKIRPLYCESCDMSFQSKEESVEHKKRLHTSVEWICEICGKQFMHRGSHYSHVRSHFPPEFTCAHCVYSAWNKSDLIKHLRIHTGIKQFRCEFCPAAYYNSSNLRSHIERSHEGLKKFFCTVCDAKFYEKSKMQRHLDSHNDIKRYECQVCHSRFTRRCYWKKHLKQHHNIDIPTVRPGRKRNILVGQAVNHTAGEPYDALSYAKPLT